MPVIQMSFVNDCYVGWSQKISFINEMVRYKTKTELKSWALQQFDFDLWRTDNGFYETSLEFNFIIETETEIVKKQLSQILSYYTESRNPTNVGFIHLPAKCLSAQCLSAKWFLTKRLWAIR